MPTPYGFKFVESCATCERRGPSHFCALGREALAEVDKFKFATSYPKGALLFVEGEEPRGVHLLCAGRVKLSTSSGDARVLITQIAGPGEALGLAAALAGEPYEVTAETTEPCQVTFFGRTHFLRLLSEHGDAALGVARQLSYNYRTAFEQVRLLGLSQSAAGKLARFLLESCPRDESDDGRTARLKLTLTHEEIGRRIGASRETVTRLLGDFKQEQLIRVKGSTLLIPNRDALEALSSY
jgi:CRP/FNR family transcriptional regulator